MKDFPEFFPSTVLVLSSTPFSGLAENHTGILFLSLPVINVLERRMTPANDEDEWQYFLESDGKLKGIKSVAHRERSYWKTLAILLLAWLAFQTSLFFIWARGIQVAGSYGKGFITDLGKSPRSQLNFGGEVSDPFQTTSNPPSGWSNGLLAVRCVLTGMERCFSIKTRTSQGLSTLRLPRQIKIGKT